MQSCIHTASGQQLLQHQQQQLQQAPAFSHHQQQQQRRPRQQPSDPVHAAAAGRRALLSSRGSVLVPHAHSSSHWVPACSHHPQHQHHQQQQQHQHVGPLPLMQRCHPQQQHTHRRLGVTTTVAAAADGTQPSSSDGASSSSSSSSQKAVPPRILATAEEETYSLRDTQVLVETAMLSAVSGLAFLLSTLLKLDSSLGYFLPLPITIAACRSGAAAAWHTMMATAFLLLVLLGPLRAMTYVLMHGVLAASLGSMWVWHWPWQASIMAGAVLRMSGQLAYLVLSSLTMNENLFSVMLANVHNLLDQLYAALGSYGSTSTLTIACMIFALLLVNGICYVFLLHVIYHVILSSMGFKLGSLPRFVGKYLSAGAPAQPRAS